MSDYFYGWSGYHRKQPWSHQNVVTATPFAFHYFSISIDDGQHLHYNFLHQPNNTFAKLLPSTTNMQNMRTWGRGGAKAYFRFHGGIGDGCCGIACRSARPLQLFDALDPIDFQMTVDGVFLKIPVTGPSVLPAEASGGTGVFLPVYPKRIHASKGDDVNNNIIAVILKLPDDDDRSCLYYK